VTGERREALVNLLALQSAQLFDGWALGCKAGVCPFIVLCNATL